MRYLHRLSLHIIIGICFATIHLLSAAAPSSQPSVEPSGQPSCIPSSQPTGLPSSQPSQPSGEPTSSPTAEPTGQPTIEPSSISTGEPSSQPTSPSAEPTGEPSGQPSAQPSGQPSQTPSSQPSAEPSSHPTGEPSKQPSGEPSSPSGQPTDQPSGQPSTQPTAEPSGQPSSAPSSPSGQPTGQPSCQPSSEPSGQPSTLPTYVYPQSLEFIGGGDTDTSVVWNAVSLGYADNSYPLYLSVDVYPTNYENRANQYATVKVNGNIVMLYCTPDESCGTEWFSCVSDLDVSSYRLEPMGGSMSVEVSSTGVNSGPCDYLTYSLYVRMFLRGALPTGQPSNEPSSQPSNEPSSQPTGEPTLYPTSDPTSSPILLSTGEPSGQPTATPSGEPSSSPSSYPTAGSSYSSHTCSGGNDSYPIQFEWTQLGYANQSDSPLYLSVAVHPTNFEVRGSQWATVSVNAEEFIAYCTPDETCGETLYDCVVDADVRDRVLSSKGGTITVTVSSTGVDNGPCNFGGYPLFSCVQLRDSIPSVKEDRFPNVWVVISISALIFFISLIMICYCKSSMKVNKALQYSVTPDEKGGTSHMNGQKGLDLEYNARPTSPNRPSSIYRGRPTTPSSPENDAAAANRRFKMQAAGRGIRDEDEDENTPLRPRRGSSRQSAGDGDVDSSRISQALQRSRSSMQLKTKKYSFDGF